MKQFNVSDPEFKEYGRIIQGYSLEAVLKAMEGTPLPEDVLYIPSHPELEALPLAGELADAIYGQMNIQIGFCNGHNTKLNALEYHRDSEVNIAVTDLLLLLGRQQEIEEDYTCHTSKVKAFFVPAGSMIEVYATTLHYAPCQISGEGFRCVVVLPKGTNLELDHKPAVKWGEEKLLAATNKWLLGHKEGGLPEGTWLGLKGENLSV